MYMYEVFCLYVFKCATCVSGATEVRRESQIPWNGVVVSRRVGTGN